MAGPSASVAAMMTASPGWYDDGHGAQRWWDGANWTEHVAAPSAESAAQTAARVPRKRRRWIIAAVVGVVLIGVVFALTQVIQLPSVHPNDSPADDDEAVAQEAAWSYFAAVVEGDCDAFFAVTTEGFRTDEGFTDCATFREMSAATPYAGSDHYGVWVPSIERSGDKIIIETIETYDSDFDPQGNKTLSTREYENARQYVLVRVGGEWLIDSLTAD